MDTITRSKLVEVTELAISLAEDTTPVPASVRETLMGVALTAEKITGGWWDASNECGCLVGTLYGGNEQEELVAKIDSDEATPEMEAEYRVGIWFATALYRLHTNRESSTFAVVEG